MIKFVGQSFIIFVLILLVLSIGFLPNFSFAGDEELKCRIQVSTDQSLDPIERFLGLDECYGIKKDHATCLRNIPKDMSLTFVEKKLARDACAKERPVLYYSDKDQYLHVVDQIMGLCEYFYPTHLLLKDLVFYQTVKHPYARPCLLLYDDPIWNYTGPDRNSILLNHLYVQTLEHLEKTKEERIEGVEDARIAKSRIMHIEDLFIKQDNEVKFLENQLEEKDELIKKNDIVIQEQLNVIESLKRKNIILTSTEIPDIVKKEILQECLEDKNLESMTFIEKYETLQECTKAFDYTPIVFGNSTIPTISKKIIEVCTLWEPAYQTLSERKFLDVIEHPLVQVCPLLFKAPIWSYDGDDREQKILEKVEEHVEKYLNEHKNFRADSVYNAFVNSGRLSIVPQIYEIGEEKIEEIENQIKVKNEIIEKQNAIILEQAMTIKELYKKITNTDFKKI